MKWFKEQASPEYDKFYAHLAICTQCQQTFLEYRGQMELNMFKESGDECLEVMKQVILSELIVLLGDFPGMLRGFSPGLTLIIYNTTSTGARPSYYGEKRRNSMRTFCHYKEDL